MTEAEFWEIIEAAKDKVCDDTDVQLAALATRLRTLPPSEIISFDRLFREQYRRTNRWDLWAAAHIINEGCSDDWFDYFRAALVAQGSEVFHRVLSNPESLVDYVTFANDDLDDHSQWSAGVEEVMYVASEAYEALTGEEFPYDDPHSDEISGEEWDEDEVDKVLPLLAAHCAKGRGES